MNEPRQIPVKIEKIRQLLPDGVWRGQAPAELIAVADDSREVIPGGTFVAIVGHETDGHVYLAKAVEAGAALLIVDSKHVEGNPGLLEPVKDRAILLVPDTRQAASILADEFYGHPSRELRIHGVTGTKGKTTTVHLIADILREAGLRPAAMGTLGVEFEENRFSSALTTPGPIEFHRRLRYLADRGATDLACEISAHAGAFLRTSSARFETVAYLNLSRDHLDDFSWEEYVDAKLTIARDAVKINPSVKGIANARDTFSAQFLDPIAPENRLRFAVFAEGENPLDPASDLAVIIHSRSSIDLSMTVRTKKWEREVLLPLIGRFNAENAAAAATVAMSMGLAPDVIAQGLNRAKSVPGRLERIDLGQAFLVVVDYAHAPQPAQEVLACLREATEGNLIAVMGAGGSRDRGKRPMMGEVLAKDADIAVITSDNPRKEEPLDIINDILVGVGRVKEASAEIIVEVDRRKAIETALERARKGDTVAILGKGHETYQIFRDRTIHFDDRETAREWLEKHGHTGGK